MAVDVKSLTAQINAFLDVVAEGQQVRAPLKWPTSSLPTSRREWLGLRPPVPGQLFSRPIVRPGAFRRAPSGDPLKSRNRRIAAAGSRTDLGVGRPRHLSGFGVRVGVSLGMALALGVGVGNHGRAGAGLLTGLDGRVAAWIVRCGRHGLARTPLATSRSAVRTHKATPGETPDLGPAGPLMGTSISSYPWTCCGCRQIQTSPAAGS